jgi:hypothetical protein
VEGKSVGVGSALVGAGHGKFSVVTFREIATNGHGVHLGFRIAAPNGKLPAQREGCGSKASDDGLARSRRTKIPPTPGYNRGIGEPWLSTVLSTKDCCDWVSKHTIDSRATTSGMG